MKKTILVSTFLLICLLMHGQSMIQSYVIEIENNRVYLDITAPKVKVGDVFSIKAEAGYIIHPVTKKKIKKEGGVLADLEIVEISKEYSIATIYPEEATKKIKVGMLAEMPELPQNYIEEESPESVKENRKIVVPIDANGVVERYLEVTGLEKLIANLNFPSYWVKSKLTAQEKNKKEFVCSSFFITDWNAKKLFVKVNDPRGNFLVGFSYALAVNGSDAWIKGSKSWTYNVSKSMSKKWREEVDLLVLSVYDTSRWSKMLCGKKTIDNKVSTGIEFSHKENGLKVKLYYDDETGLINFWEYSKFQCRCIEYKSYGDFILCSKFKRIYSSGRILQETFELQEVDLNNPVDNSFFTKEKVKNAFK